MVNKLKICKGGNTATVVTYGLFGRPLYKEVPLKNISCTSTRSDNRSFLALKIKPKWFYYLVDTKGEFHHPKLFDYTIGTKVFKAY